MTFDHFAFALKDTLGFVPVPKSTIVPSCTYEHNVVLFACGIDCQVIDVDRCTVVFKNTVGEADVSVQPQHVLGNLFAIAVPPMSFVKEPTVVKVELWCGSKQMTCASVEMRIAPRVFMPFRPYTAFRLPLHYASFAGDVVSALEILERCS